MARPPPQRPWIAALAICAFALRGAIPAGVMLASGPDGRLVLEVCSGFIAFPRSPSSLSPGHAGMSSGHAAHEHADPGAGHDGSGHRVLCPFAAATSPGPMPVLFVQAALPQTEALRATIAPSGIISRSILRTQTSRGPPVRT